jgi:hypothetical protein
VDIGRRLYWMALLTAAAVGAYLAYHVYRRRSAERREPWPAETPDTSPGVSDGSEQASAERDTMVVSSMSASSLSPAERYDENGSPIRVVSAVPMTDGRRHEGATPRRQRLSGRTLAGLGALAGAAAIALGAWAVVENTGSDGSVEGVPEGVQSQELISLLSSPTTERIPLAGSDGRIILVAAANGSAYLVLDGLGLAPTGKSYQAWVIRPGAEAPASAAVFEGSELVVPLALAVQPGAVVAITIERAGGVPAPTQTPTIVAERT